MKYAAFKNGEWMFDLLASNEVEALAIAKAQEPEITHVEIVSENTSGAV